MTKATPKFLSWLLRHGLVNGELDQKGWIDIDRLIAIARDTYGRTFTHRWLSETVANDGKQRFQVIDNRIRAVQGHSIKGVDPTTSMVIVTDPKLLVGLFHATYFRHLESILKTGLNPMNRTCVHMAIDKKLTRPDSELAILIDVEKWYGDGNVFYMAPNGVVCSDKPILPEYFLDIVEL